LKQFPTVAAEIADRPAAAYYADDNRTNLSNAAVDFIHAGKVDEAEQPARDLLVRSPTCTMITIPSAWSMRPEAITVYEARGDHRQAADCYRKVTDVIGVFWTTTTPLSARSSTGSIRQPPPDRVAPMLAISEGAAPTPITNRA
jgi:hypothetical protein